MKQLLFLLSIVSLFLLSCENEFEPASEDFTEFGIKNSDLHYEIGEGTLSQFRFDSVEKTSTHLHTWDIPFINEMNPYDVFLIVENNIHRVLDYEYVLYVQDSTEFFYRHMTKYYRVGRFDWDFETQSPTIRTFTILDSHTRLPKKEYHKELRKGSALLSIIFLMIIMVVIGKFYTEREKK